MTFEIPSWMQTRLMRRLAAVALAALAAVALVCVTVVPVAQGYLELQSTMDEQRRLLGKLEQFAANKERAQLLARQSAEVIGSGVFLEGGTDAMRAANLQALLNGVVESHGVRLRSTRTLAPAERDGLRLIGVQAELETNIVKLQAIILAFELMRPYLFIQSLQAAPIDLRGRQGDELKVRIGVVGAVPASGGKG